MAQKVVGIEARPALGLITHDVVALLEGGDEVHLASIYSGEPFPSRITLEFDGEEHSADLDYSHRDD